jgi:transcriptional regulator with XRE-family HTH domain
MSKQAVFSAAQNAALRTVLLSLKGSQTDIGRDLGIKQQNVARLQRDERAGFAYGTAVRLVRLAGFDGVDSFFAEKGCSVPVPVPSDSTPELLDSDAPHARAAE